MSALTDASPVLDVVDYARRINTHSLSLKIFEEQFAPLLEFVLALDDACVSAVFAYLALALYDI